MAEQARLDETRGEGPDGPDDGACCWRKWGPYLSERQWATVREDYSSDGSCWEYFPHDDARSRAYRWGEDGILGICDQQCQLCFGLCVWNGRDPILKERLFGLTANEGNHGEDVKELYYYLDSTPTHSYMSGLYKYPHKTFPYEEIVRENGQRLKCQREYELLDTGVFDDGEYWDIKAEYCKADPCDILARITVSNRGTKAETIHVLPQLWFRNVWSWGNDCDMSVEKKPRMEETKHGYVDVSHCLLGDYVYEIGVDQNGSKPMTLFTENETNNERIFHVNNSSPFVKDAFHQLLLKGDKKAVNPENVGTKCAPHFVLSLSGGEEFVIKLRLYQPKKGATKGRCNNPQADVFSRVAFDDVFTKRKREADEFYDTVIVSRDEEEYNVLRQAYAGLLWSKQFYYYIVQEWLYKSRHNCPPDVTLRNMQWRHLFNKDVISMPDKWEYPWYAAWDLAFHMLPFASIDIEFCKQQTLLLLGQGYMHPNGQIPAYEFAYSDVNPPVHAYAVLKIYKASGRCPSTRDQTYLARCFQKLVLNFAWWVNRKDPDGLNIFEGGFLGLDNIGAFDRSKPVPTGGHLYQADGTAWMAFFSELMLECSLILAERDPVYEDMASKFFEHFIYIMDAINFGKSHLWDETDEFYYDTIEVDGQRLPLKIRSMVGVVPLFSSLMLSESETKKHPDFYRRTKWFLENKMGMEWKTQILYRVKCKDTGKEIIKEEETDVIMLSLVAKERLMSVMKYILDEDEFLSPYGIRSLSKYHEKHPFTFEAKGQTYCVRYDPAESSSTMFGGNSNWRGPIWLPMNYMVIENLERYDSFYGDSLKVECPTRSGNWMRLGDVAKELSGRLAKLVLPGPSGYRPCHGDDPRYATDPNWKDLVLFYEYFNGDTGEGCGASHQTGWSALLVNFLRCVNDRPLIVDHSHADIGVQP